MGPARVFLTFTRLADFVNSRRDRFLESFARLGVNLRLDLIGVTPLGGERDTLDTPDVPLDARCGVSPYSYIK